MVSLYLNYTPEIIKQEFHWHLQQYNLRTHQTYRGVETWFGAYVTRYRVDFREKVESGRWFIVAKCKPDIEDAVISLAIFQCYLKDYLEISILTSPRLYTVGSLLMLIRI